MYTLVRYLGGFYRKYVPKIHRRLSKIEFNSFGEVVDNKYRPSYHSGFPEQHAVTVNP